MNKFYEIIRYAIFLVYSVISAFLCSTMAVEVSNGNKIVWREMPKTNSIKLLIGLILLTIVFYFYDYKYIKKKNRIISEELFDALSENGIFDEVAKNIKKSLQINDTSNLKTIAETMKTIKKITKK